MGTVFETIVQPEVIAIGNSRASTHYIRGNSNSNISSNNKNDSNSDSASNGSDTNNSDKQ